MNDINLDLIFYGAIVLIIGAVVVSAIWDYFKK